VPVLEKGHAGVSTYLWPDISESNSVMPEAGEPVAIHQPARYPVLGAICNYTKLRSWRLRIREAPRGKCRKTKGIGPGIA